MAKSANGSWGWNFVVDLVGGDALGVGEASPGHEHAGEGGAGLARVQVALADAVADGRLEVLVVEVVEQDVGRLAAELEGDALEGVGRRLGDALAGPGRAGERHHVDVGVRDDGLADDGAGAGDEVEHAGGQADVVDDLGEDVGVERRDLASA